MKKFNKTIMLCAVFLCFSTFLSFGQGARYTGSYTKSAPLQYVDKSNFVIDGLDIAASDKPGIALYGCENVIIKNSRISPSPLKPAIYLFNCKNITVIDNTFENVQSGLLASTSQGIKFEYNDLTNILGNLRGSTELGVMAQFIVVSGEGNSISHNVCENLPGESYPEDLINISQSKGTAQSPISIKGNWIRGGGPSTSGGGINLGDLGGAYQIAEDNILVNPGQYGIGISGGSNMTLRNNKVYAAKQHFTNVGIVAANWYEKELGKSINITVANNSINYKNKDGAQNNWWLNSNMEPINGRETNVYNSSITSSILPDKIIGRARMGVTPGDNGTVDLPEEGTDENPGDVTGEQPGIKLPNIVNHPSIEIYLDSYNRACVNTSGSLSYSAKIYAANSAGEIIFEQRLTRFHTVLPKSPKPGTYYIFVSNGDRQHLKSLYIK